MSDSPSENQEAEPSTSGLELGDEPANEPHDSSEESSDDADAESIEDMTNALSSEGFGVSGAKNSSQFEGTNRLLRTQRSPDSI
jgi:hypothetical protein